MTPALSIDKLSKSFAGPPVLRDVSFTVARGSVHALLGHNGSGKSTLIKVLAGFHAPDPGARVELFGKHVVLPVNPHAVSRLGLSFVHQDLGLVPSLSVLDNLRIDSLTAPRRWHIDWRAERRCAVGVLSRFELDLRPETRIDSLSQAERAMVAIVRAFETISSAHASSGSPGLLILDEPTPFLPRPEVERLFLLVRRLAAQGASVLLISHDIDQVRELADHATVLRDGAVAASFDPRMISRDEMIHHIVGKRTVRGPRTAVEAPKGEISASIVGLTGPRLQPVDLCLRKGEIVGLTGLVDAGYAQVLYHLFGATRADAGTLCLDGTLLSLAELTPRRALEAGIAFLPENRQTASAIGSLDITDNLFVPDVSRFRRSLGLSRSGMRHAAREIITRYDVRPADPAMKLAHLSGGNAQKVLLARWLKLPPRLLLLEEPTQGVDVGAREQLFAAIRGAAADGSSVLVASADHEQLVMLCHRVCVFAQGSIVAQLAAERLTKTAIAQSCYVNDNTGRNVSYHSAS